MTMNTSEKLKRSRRFERAEAEEAQRLAEREAIRSRISQLVDCLRSAIQSTEELDTDTAVSINDLLRE